LSARRRAELQAEREEVSNKRLQAVLPYAKLNELLGQTERGPIEALAADPSSAESRSSSEHPAARTALSLQDRPHRALKSTDDQDQSSRLGLVDLETGEIKQP
jgi:hypothetical protein